MITVSTEIASRRDWSFVLDDFKPNLPHLVGSKDFIVHEVVPDSPPKSVRAVRVPLSTRCRDPRRVVMASFLALPVLGRWQP